VHGIAATGRIITGATLTMLIVFAGFAAGQLVMFQQSQTAYGRGHSRHALGDHRDDHRKWIPH
jgi:hypothetical protein